MRSLRGTVTLVILASWACSSALEPRSDITLLVTNATCRSGRCDSLAVLGFPSNQPRTPGGFWSIDLGLVTTPQACFTFPPSATFRVIGVNTDGTRDTTTFAWTSADELSLGEQPPSASRFQASPSTTAFVPATAAGWSITFPAGSQLSTSSACTKH
jgi:hypothetical protein